MVGRIARWALICFQRAFRCRVNGELPGHVFKTAAGKELHLKIKAALTTQDPISSIEIIKNGKVDRAIPFDGWKKLGQGAPEQTGAPVSDPARSGAAQNDGLKTS